MRRCIERKRDGEKLQEAELCDMVASYLGGDLPEAQMAVFCMASVWRGLDLDETYALTKATLESGRTLHFNSGSIVVDKHSTGGVADLVSLVVVPLVAACGVRVAKLSGRALGHTGGTIDKLEAIPGFNIHLSPAAFVQQVERIGCAIAAQSDDMVPADRRLYALRDLTGTVPSRGLIAASIVSKKVAGGAGAFVFDVKAGRGSFMREVGAAHDLARMLVDIAARFGKPARALVTNMHEPVGRFIGTGLEVMEARDFLRGTHRDPRAEALCSAIGTAMLEAAVAANGQAGVNGQAGDAARAQKGQARSRVEDVLRDGAGYEKFVRLVEAQGSSRSALEAMSPSSRVIEVRAARAGFIGGIDVMALGNLARALSGQDSAGGIEVRKRIGEPVTENEPVARLYSKAVEDHVSSVRTAFEITPQRPVAEPLIYEAMTS
ncbi:MAG: pyrimidine-nucleoside phosphorylase [Vulcanimicrobiaceae bacterium]